MGIFHISGKKKKKMSRSLFQLSSQKIEIVFKVEFKLDQQKAPEGSPQTQCTVIEAQEHEV